MDKAVELTAKNHALVVLKYLCLKVAIAFQFDKQAIRI
jgi:hypothetical protein